MADDVHYIDTLLTQIKTFDTFLKNSRNGMVAMAVFILELELLESNDSFTEFWWDI